MKRFVKTLTPAWKIVRIDGLLVLSTFVILCPTCWAAEPAEGVALMIVYDTSGSMQQKVRDVDGRPTPKHVIAGRALTTVLDRLQAVRSGPFGTSPLIDAGMVVFEGDHAAIAVKCRPFDPQPFRDWLARHKTLTRGTPLGDSVRLAGRLFWNRNVRESMCS
jgi:hypothetical protein